MAADGASAAAVCHPDPLRVAAYSTCPSGVAAMRAWVRVEARVGGRRLFRLLALVVVRLGYLVGVVVVGK